MCMKFIDVPKTHDRNIINSLFTCCHEVIKTSERLRSTNFHIPSWCDKCMYHDHRISIYINILICGYYCNMLSVLGMKQYKLVENCISIIWAWLWAVLICFYSVDVPKNVRVTVEIINLHAMWAVLFPPLVKTHLYVCLFQSLVAGRMILSCTFQFTTNITEIYATYLRSSVWSAVLMTVVPKTDICWNTWKWCCLYC